MEEESKLKNIIKSISLTLLVFLVVFTIVLTVITFLFNIIYEVYQKMFLTGSLLNPDEIDLSFSNIATFTTISSLSLIFIILIGISFLASIILVFKLITNYGQLKKNQKGSSRFASLKEIQAQYKAVPDKKERFEGSGGVPIARYKDKLFIDDGSVNNMIIGTTRSGKGETVVFQLIDIYSRAKEQASMLINDPKGELFSASKEELEKLGYNVEILNLMTPEQSMSYNILQQTVDAFVNEDYALAEQHARSIGFMLYNDPHAKDPVWWKSSASLCTSLILALCEQSKDEPEKITMYNVALMLSDLGSRTVLRKNEATGKTEEVDALDDFFSKFPNNHPAKLQYSTVNFSTGQMRASILANTNSELDIFTVNGIAKLTSKTTFNTTKLGYKKWLKGKTIPDQRVIVTLPDGSEESIRSNSHGIFAVYFDSSFTKNDTFNVKVKKENFQVKIKDMQKTINSYGEEVFEGYYETESNSDKLKIIELVQYEKPTALFMVTPDYDATFNIIASIFISEVYSDLSRVATNLKSGKCQREVIFILDEFGNMPTLDNFTNTITVCLGRRIRFNLVIQAYSQLEEKYGEGWKTIDGNCGNTLYLLTADEDTAERVSKKLGEKTITLKSRTGQPISLNKSKTESVDSRRLLNSTEVMSLKEGEMIVIKPIKRQDSKRKRVKSYPIYNRGKTALKYRFEYLSEHYNTDKSINDFDIECEHTMLNLDELKVNFDENYYSLNKEQKDLLEKEEMERDQKVKDKKREQILKREKKKKEEKLNDFINQEVITKDIISENLIHQAFNNDKQIVEDYAELGLIDFRDLVISYSEEISEDWSKKLLSKIDNAIIKYKEDIGVDENSEKK